MRAKARPKIDLRIYFWRALPMTKAKKVSLIIIVSVICAAVLFAVSFYCLGFSALVYRSAGVTPTKTEAAFICLIKPDR